MIIEVQNNTDTEFRLVWYGPADASGDPSAAGTPGASANPAAGGGAYELEDMTEEVPLDSPDWEPSNAAEEEGGPGVELRARHEVRLQYGGAGPRTPRIAGEIADRKLLAEHIAKKKMGKRSAEAAAAAEEMTAGIGIGHVSAADSSSGAALASPAGDAPECFQLLEDG